MSKVINSYDLASGTLSLTECSDGFWLYDETRGMNLSMRAKTEREAFVEALEYYQERLTRVEGHYRELNKKVQDFVGLVSEEDEE